MISYMENDKPKVIHNNDHTHIVQETSRNCLKQCNREKENQTPNNRPKNSHWTHEADAWPQSSVEQ